MNPKDPVNGFTLIDSEARSRTRAETWAHPDSAALGQIKVGAYIKVGLTHPTLDGERFWACVREKTDRGFVVQVDQDMISTHQHGISDRDLLLVDPKNVFGIVDDAGATVWEAR
jgi:hypothetical protein